MIRFTLILFGTSLLASFATAEDCKTTSNDQCTQQLIYNDGNWCWYIPGENWIRPVNCQSAGCTCLSVPDPPQTVCSSTITVDCNGDDQHCTQCNSNSPYCLINSNNPACKYCGESSSNCDAPCKLDGIVGLTSDEEEQILKKHNDLRRIVAKGQESRSSLTGSQPKAANMIELEWDEELAKVAQAYIEQCNFAHDDKTLRRIPADSGTSVGQNLAYYGISALSDNKYTEDGVQAWYDEVADFPNNNVSPWLPDSLISTNTGQTGHYTQVVWAETQRVGCGYIKYLKGGIYRELLNCNYYPTGNFRFNGVGHVYQIGNATTLCPDDFKTRNDGLCKKCSGTEAECNPV